jgi:outer membrane protein assembly factor BamE
VLGTPLVVDTFRTDRWDYVYVYQKGGVVTEHRKLTVFFEGDKLLRVEGDVKPATGGATGEGAAAGVGTPKPDPSAAPETAATPAQAPAAPPAPAPDKPEGASLTTTTGEPVGTIAPKAEPVKTEAGPEKPKEEKPQEEKGFFGRMLDKIGF